MGKLSTAQLNVLHALARGETLHYLSGINPHYFLGGDGMKSVNYRTVDALYDGGFIQVREKRVAGTTYQLTELGRKATSNPKTAKSKPSPKE
jgi:hypothetical protein